MLNNEVFREVLRRKALADRYYENYREYYFKGEYSKASEYLWGVVNSLVFAIGLFYGKRISEHREISEFLKELGSKYQEIRDGYMPIQRLHANFYHDFMKKEMFDDDKLKAEKLVEKLAEILMDKIRTLEYKN